MVWWSNDPIYGDNAGDPIAIFKDVAANPTSESSRHFYEFAKRNRSVQACQSEHARVHRVLLQPDAEHWEEFNKTVSEMKKKRDITDDEIEQMKKDHLSRKQNNVDRNMLKFVQEALFT